MWTTGVVATLAYTAGNQSNRLSDEQMNFTQYQSQNYENQLPAPVWNAVMEKLTTWVQNHEFRLQVLADNTNCWVLTDEDTSFINLLSTEHNNQLTSQMRDGLMTRLENDIRNYECRLRKEAGCELIPGRTPSTSSECVVSNPNQLTVNESDSSTFIRFSRLRGANGWFNNMLCNRPTTPLPDEIYLARGPGVQYFTDWNDVIFRATNEEIEQTENKNCFELYVRVNFSWNDQYDVKYIKYGWNVENPIYDDSFICKTGVNTCHTDVYWARCELKISSGIWPSCQGKEKASCKSTYGCRWGYWTAVE